MCKIHAFLLQNWFCCNLHTYVADFFVAIYAFLCGKKINQLLHSWRKNDKYQVWVPYILYIYTTLQCYKVKYAATLQQIPKLYRFLKSAEWIRYIPIYLDLPSDCDIWPAD